MKAERDGREGHGSEERVSNSVRLQDSIGGPSACTSVSSLQPKEPIGQRSESAGPLSLKKPLGKAVQLTSSTDPDEPEPTNAGFQPLSGDNAFVQAKTFGERDKSLTLLQALW